MVTDTPTPQPEPETIAAAIEESKSFFEQAQEAIGDAIESTVEAVKENPVTAAAIAAGAVAAVGGAAYAASKLLGGEETPAKAPSKK